MQGKEREAYERLGWYVDIFGKENFFIELQEHSIPELVQVNKTLAPWAEKFGLHLVATNDVHYVREQDGSPHDVLLCVQTGVPISQQNRMRMSDGSLLPQEPRADGSHLPSLSRLAGQRLRPQRASGRNVRSGSGRPDLPPARPADPRRTSPTKPTCAS
jgi:hypothetical protein